MLRNYLAVALRNLRKNKLYSLINILGLGLGLATGFVMLVWVYNEYSMNRYHRNADRIYQINAHLQSGNDETVWENTPAPVTPFIRENLSEVEEVARLGHSGVKMAVGYLNKNFVEDRIGYTENEFFRVFDFPVVAGDSRQPLAPGLSVVLTEKTAKKYFGGDDPIGKVLRFRDTSFTVSAVIRDFPVNSSIQFDLLFTLDLIRLKFRGNGQWKTIDTDWGNYNYWTFCLLKPGASTGHVSAALLGALKKANPEASMKDFPLRPLSKLYLYQADGSKGRIILVELFLLIAIFVLLIASINYINLVTARATQRVREIGIRKVVGAERRHLTWQFFIETGVLLLLAALTAAALMKWLLPVYQQASGNFEGYDLTDWRLLKILLITLGIVWLITGLYPAVLLSSFNSIDSLKGKVMLARTSLIRKSLVVLQFFVSIVLILGTVFIHMQMDYIQHKDMHLDSQNVMVFPLYRMKDKGGEFATALKQQSYVRDVTTASSSLFEGSNTTTDIEWTGKRSGEDMWIAQFEVDSNFVRFFHTEIREGKGFENLSSGGNEFVLNETAIRKMGLKNPVGQTIRFHEQPGTIIGVVKDFHFESLHAPIMPAILRFSNESPVFIYARIGQKDAQKLIAFAENFWKKVEPVLPLEYAFVDDQLARQYDKETRAARLFDAFALITMFISCLGLFGLATHAAERRIKEIGIRKVLGADVPGLSMLMAREFVILVSIAIVLAVPVVWICMDRLLNFYAYRIQLSWWVFAVVCLASAVVAIGTVSFQAVRAALVSPVRSLRTE